MQRARRAPGQAPLRGGGGAATNGMSMPGKGQASGAATGGVQRTAVAENATSTRKRAGGNFPPCAHLELTNLGSPFPLCASVSAAPSASVCGSSSPLTSPTFHFPRFPHLFLLGFLCPLWFSFANFARGKNSDAPYATAPGWRISSAGMAGRFTAPAAIGRPSPCIADTFPASTSPSHYRGNSHKPRKASFARAPRILCK